MNEEIQESPSLENIAFMELKGKIVELMHAFTEKHCGKDNPSNLYPRTPYIIVDVLTCCLNEASYQVKADYIHFTPRQRDHICYQIGDWYLMMKPLLEGQHNLGFMKEKLKLMICGD